MKNILLLTSVYPADDLPNDNTPVVLYFAREWVNMGYHVEVIHSEKYYPKIAYFIINIFRDIISKYYKFIFPVRRYSEERHYELERVNVHRLPIFKISPLLLFSKKAQTWQLKRIKDLSASLNFTPDVIIGHWPNPQLFLVSELGKLFNVPTCMVQHTDVETIGRMYGNKAKEVIASIDIWGFRSSEIKNRFENLYGKANKSFFCFSGIPGNRIKPPQRTFKNKVKNFLFVGLLIPRKYPVALVKAVNEAFKEGNFHINFVGKGREEKSILKLARELNITSKISLFGRIPRDHVLEMMKTSDCFIMISKPETFGLVYLEAMSMGCITIGSKGEGIDGIIQHGKNGFLSEAGDYANLAELLRKISKLTEEELIAVSNQAIQTALELTDEKAAEHYIRSVEAIKSIQENGTPIKF